MKNIILSGGNGTRLWPLSRTLLPKQFLQIFDGDSLFQLTLKRNKNICNKFSVISNVNQYFLAFDQVEEINYLENVKFLLEEEAKNTAAAIAFAAFDSDFDDILFITPSDHLINNEKLYFEAINKAKEFANQGNLVTFGIKPTNPNTGYGYIEAEQFNVKQFHEKPDIKTAKQYFESGNFFWNSGMFMFKAGLYLEELQKYSYEVYDEALKSYKSKQELSNNQIRFKNMSNIPDISIDYAVMEKSDKIKIVPSKFEWNDVGSFESLSKEIESSKNVIDIDSKNNFILSDKLIATIGVEDLIVIDTKDALLISNKDKTQQVKDVVSILKKENIDITQTHTVVHRPWGTFETLIENKGYKIKRIIVKPNKRLSLQKHFHRSEHWIVVSGTAEVQIGDNSYLVRPNESTYIKAGELHRLSNPGKIPVILIEAQVGEYTEEDDIVRLEDDFRREE